MLLNALICHCICIPGHGTQMVLTYTHSLPCLLIVQVLLCIAACKQACLCAEVDNAVWHMPAELQTSVVDTNAVIRTDSMSGTHAASTLPAACSWLSELTSYYWQAIGLLQTHDATAGPLVAAACVMLAQLMLSDASSALSEESRCAKVIQAVHKACTALNVSIADLGNRQKDVRQAIVHCSQLQQVLLSEALHCIWQAHKRTAGVPTGAVVGTIDAACALALAHTAAVAAGCPPHKIAKLQTMLDEVDASQGQRQSA
jgi:hypothetical protein